MNIIMQEAIKLIKINMRNPKSMVSMIIYPIVFMLILGAALSGSFDGTRSLMRVKVLYTTTENKDVTEAFSKFTKAAEEKGIKFEETTDLEKGMSSVKNAEYACYIKMNSSNIELYENDRYNFEASLIETMLKVFVDRYNVILQIANENPTALSSLKNNTDTGYVKSVSLVQNRQPRSKDYYAVVMLTMIILYASFSSIFSFRGEKTRKTGPRIMCSPARKHEMMIGKILGNCAITSLQILIVFLFSKYILGAYWGTNIVSILLILFSEIILAVSLGIGLGFVFKNEMAGLALLNIVVPIISLFGGAFVPLKSFGDALGFLSNISPLKWVNEAILHVIYSNDFSKVVPTIVINLLISLVLIALSSLKYRKEAVV